MNEKEAKYYEDLSERCYKKGIITLESLSKKVRTKLEKKLKCRSKQSQ